MSSRPLTAAERQRRYRYRRKHDLLLAQAEVPAALVVALIEAGLLPEEAASDPQELGRALVAAVQRQINGAVECPNFGDYRTILAGKRTSNF